MREDEEKREEDGDQEKGVAALFLFSTIFFLPSLSAGAFVTDPYGFGGVFGALWLRIVACRVSNAISLALNSSWCKSSSRTTWYTLEQALTPQHFKPFMVQVTPPGYGHLAPFNVTVEVVSM